MSASFSVVRNWMLSRCCSAGFSRRIALTREMSASSGPPSERDLISYFSEWSYSSLPARTGVRSKDSKPE